MIKRGPIEPELVIDPEKHQKIEQLRRIAELLDGQFRIPGTDIEFGLDAIIGLLPGIGDLISGGISMWLIREARRLGAPRWSGLQWRGPSLPSTRWEASGAVGLPRAGNKDQSRWL